MRWKVKGADASTGEDRSISIEAASSDEAQDRARYNGILVESVARTDATTVTGAPLSYATPGNTRRYSAFKRPLAGDSPISLPAFRRLSASLRWAALVLSILSLFSVFAGAILVLIGIVVALAADPINRPDAIMAIALGVGCVVQWALFRGVAAALEMIAELGYAMRQMQSSLAKLENAIDSDVDPDNSLEPQMNADKR